MKQQRKVRKTNPVIFVFCEGETEQRYIDILRSHFRVPIQIVTKVLNTRISHRLVETYIKSSGYPNVDKVFLFYDGDRKDVVERLYGIKNACVLLSCPCVELWFLLHFAEHHVNISASDIVKIFSKHQPTYKKGEIQSRLREVLLSSWQVAAIRAKALIPKTNPSTTVYMLPEFLESLKGQK